MAVVPGSLPGAEKGQAIVEKYKSAHEAKDIEALKALVYWEGATRRSREIIEQRLIRHLNLQIKQIAFRPLAGDEQFESPGYRPNLKPAGWLVMFFKAPEGDSRFFGKSFVVGKKNGDYFIVTAEPVH